MNLSKKYEVLKIMCFSKNKSKNLDCRSIGLRWEIPNKVQLFNFIFKVIEATFVEGCNKNDCNDY